MRRVVMILIGVGLGTTLTGIPVFEDEYKLLWPLILICLAGIGILIVAYWDNVKSIFKRKRCDGR